MRWPIPPPWRHAAACPIRPRLLVGFRFPSLPRMVHLQVSVFLRPLDDSVCEIAMP